METNTHGDGIGPVNQGIPVRVCAKAGCMWWAIDDTPHTGRGHRVVVLAPPRYKSTSKDLTKAGKGDNACQVDTDSSFGQTHRP